MASIDRRGGTHDTPAAKAREERRAEALRSNLKRRKVQVRGRAEAGTEAADAPPATGGNAADPADT